MAGTVVIKYGGSAMDDPAKVGEILAEIAGLARGGVPIVLVHGGGKEIRAEMKKRGLKPVFVEGFRVTNEATMVAVEEVEEYRNQEREEELCCCCSSLVVAV